MTALREGREEDDPVPRLRTYPIATLFGRLNDWRCICRHAFTDELVHRQCPRLAPVAMFMRRQPAAPFSRISQRRPATMAASPVILMAGSEPDLRHGALSPAGRHSIISGLLRGL